MIRNHPIQAVLIGWLSVLTLITLVMPDYTLLALIGTAAVGCGALAFLFPGAALMIGMISNMISVEYFLLFHNFNLNNASFLASSSFHKIICLALMVPAILRYGLKPVPNPVILTFIAMFAATFVFSTRLPGLDNVQVLQTLIGLSMPFLVFNMRLKEGWIESHLRILAWFPLISVVLGYVAQMAHLHDLLGRVWESYVFEVYTGAYRLQGINIPAGLAFICYGSFAIAIFQAVLYQRQGYWVLAGIIVIITVLTGTRMPLAAEIMFAGLGVLISSNRTINAGAKFNFAVIGAIMLSVALIFYWPNLEARFASKQSGEVINTSARSQIWEIEYKAFSENPVFGRGLGAGAIILLDEDWENLKQARATHNEYLRLLVDGGIFGLGAFIIALIVLMVSECRGTGTTATRLTFAFFVSFAVYSFTDNTLSSPATPNLFYAIALLLLQARAAQRAHSGAVFRLGPG